MQIVNTFEAKTNLSKLIEQVLGGKEIVIGKAGKPVAKLVAYVEVVKPRVPGLMKGSIQIPDNFDDEDEEINKMFYGE